MAGLVEYPFQLRPGLWVRLRLPSDFNREDAQRLAKQVAQVAQLPQRQDALRIADQSIVCPQSVLRNRWVYELAALIQRAIDAGEPVQPVIDNWMAEKEQPTPATTED